MSPHFTFNAWSSLFGWPGFLILVVGASVALVVVLYRYESRLVPPGVGGTLLALRLIVLGLLFFTLLEPVIAWTLDEKKTGRIVVAIDVSGSMTTKDEHATPGEKLRWARAVGMIGNANTAARLDRWQAAFDSGAEPEWVDANETDDQERRARLAASRKKHLEEILKEAGKTPRREYALRLLSRSAHPVLPALAKEAPVQLIVFGGGTASATPESLEQLATQPPEGVLPEITDLSQILTSASAGTDAVPIRGVVLLTDGRDTSGHDPIPAAQRLGAAHTPVIPILFGSTRRPKDIAIASLDFPPTSFKEDHPLLKAVILNPGFEGRELTINLERQGKEPVTKTITPQGPTTQIEFPLDVGEIGRHEFTIKTEVLPGETRDDNNQKGFALTVVDDKVDVVLLDGEARWEFRYIDNALKRDSRVNLHSVVFEQPYLGLLPEPYFPHLLPLPPDATDLEKSPFAEADLVIIGDVSPANLPPVAWELLEKFVGEAGGTLVLTAGKRHFPQGHASEIVQQLLPVTNLAAVSIDGPAALRPPQERGFRLRITPEGASEPMFQFAADPQTNRQIWDSLPGHLWGLIGTAKPGATVFAAAVQPGEPDVLETERQRAVIVHQHYGSGQVLWVGIDSTWRWRHLVGDEYHHRFWGQISRWAAESKAAAGNEFVRFGPDAPEVEAGKEVMLRARFSRPFVRKFPNVKAKVELFRDEPGAAAAKPFTTLDLKPAENRPLVHEGRAVSLPAGAYRAKLVVEGADLKGDIEAWVYVQEPKTIELADVSANQDLLTQIAQASSGKLLLPDQVQEIPRLLASPEKQVTTREERRLWDHWLTLTAFCVLLTAEWITRKLHGLP